MVSASGTCYTRDVPNVTGSGAAAAALEIRSAISDAKQREQAIGAR